MTNQPLISIIIPTYNRANLLPETLESVIAQTYENWECIVIDDGSTDGTEELLKKYIQKDNRIKCYKRPNQYKLGGNGARNYGFDISKGEYIQWFDSDDLMVKDKIQKQVAKLQNSSLSMCVCQSSVFSNNPSEIIDVKTDKIYFPNILEDFINSNISIMTPSTLFKRKFLLENELRFDENLNAAQEWEFYVRVLSKIQNFEFIPENLVKIRRHRESISLDEQLKYNRIAHYIKARKIVRIYLKENNLLTKEIEKAIQNFGQRFIIVFVKEKKFKLLNQAIFSDGFSIHNLISFFSIYFLIFTKKNKSNTIYI